MTPRQAQIALAGFVLLGGGVVHNALYMQGDAVAARRTAADSVSSPAPERTRRPEAVPPAGKPGLRPGEASKRTAQLKPDSARTDLTPDALPDEAGVDTIRAIQRELAQRGFGPVVGDGVMRPVTRAAILAYEYDHRLPLTGEATEALLTRLVLGVPATTEVSGGREVRSPHAETLIKQVQRGLLAAGYRPGAADGRLTPETLSAIRAFEEDQGIVPVRGRISADVFAKLQESAIRLKAAEAR
jgi:peptidoglycan hydrolase-like protein with peptidoglycan-binding domain